MTGTSPYKKEEADREEGRVKTDPKTEAGSGAAQPRAKESLGLPDAGQGRKGPTGEQGCPNIWHLWATLEEELSCATH